VKRCKAYWMIGLIAVAAASCAPRPPRESTKAVLAILSRMVGGEVPSMVAAQVAAIAEGREVKPVKITPQNQIVSPVTGKLCSFITKDGLTPAGIAVVKLLLGSAAEPAPESTQHGK